jgi:hypothetical protein
MLIKNNITNNIVRGIVHCPDFQINPIWKNLKKIKFQNFKPCKDFKIITWNNYINDGIFENSCKGLKIEVYGKEIKKWSNYLKFKFNLSACESDDCKYIMGCDSHDAILISEPELILNKFLDSNCKLLFNSEIKFFPDIDEPNVKKWKEFQNKLSKSPFRFLNSGVWVGEKEFVFEFFKDCLNTKINDLYDNEKYKFSNKESIGCDQSIIHSKFEKYYPDIKLDYNSSSFLNIANLNKNNASFAYKFL